MDGRFLYLIRHGEAAEGGELTARGEEQASVAGERLRAVPLTGILHSPQSRAVRTAQIVAGCVPGVSLAASDLLDDYIPPDPDLTELPASYGRLVSAYSPAERMAGARMARAAVARFGGPGASAESGAVEHELLVTHNFLIGWFVRDALGAPGWRWLGLNQQNCALTVLLYRAELPPSLLSFNDGSHLTAPLRWTGFPLGLRPPLNYSVVIQRGSGCRCRVRSCLAGQAAWLAGPGSARSRAGKGMSQMAYAYIGSMRTKAGCCDEVIALLLSGADGLRTVGCQVYAVCTDPADGDIIWVSEVWDSAEAHAASLQLPETKAAIGAAMPMLTGEFTRQELIVAGGLGVHA